MFLKIFPPHSNFYTCELWWPVLVSLRGWLFYATSILSTPKLFIQFIINELVLIGFHLVYLIYFYP